MKALPAFFSLFLSFWVFGTPKPVTRRIPLKNGINLVSIEKKSKIRYLSDTYFPYFLDRDGWKDIDQKAFLPPAICIYGWGKEPLIIDEYDSGFLDWEVEIREGWSILPLKRISTILERLGVIGYSIRWLLKEPELLAAVTADNTGLAWEYYGQNTPEEMVVNDPEALIIFATKSLVIDTGYSLYVEEHLRDIPIDLSWFGLAPPAGGNLQVPPLPVSKIRVFSLEKTSWASIKRP